MTGVHIIALVSALVTLSVIVELSRRRHLHDKLAHDRPIDAAAAT